MSSFASFPLSLKCAKQLLSSRKIMSYLKRKLVKLLRWIEEDNIDTVCQKTKDCNTLMVVVGQGFHYTLLCCRVSFITARINPAAKTRLNRQYDRVFST